MKFDIIVGNPPYGFPQKGSSPNLHLKIMNSIIKFCTNKLVFIMPSKPIVSQLQEPWFSIFKNAVCNKIEVVGKGVFKNTDMDNTVYFRQSIYTKSPRFEITNIDPDFGLATLYENHYYKREVAIDEDGKPFVKS